MTDEKRIWMFFLTMTFLITGFLVLLRTDGLSDRTVFAIGLLTLVPHVLLFRTAWRLPWGSKLQKVFRYWAAWSFAGLGVTHLIVDPTSVLHSVLH